MKEGNRSISNFFFFFFFLISKIGFEAKRCSVALNKLPSFQ
jgi:hypothetical protein